MYLMYQLMYLMYLMYRRFRGLRRREGNYTAYRIDVSPGRVLELDLGDVPHSTAGQLGLLKAIPMLCS